jgi:hypothetical protein
MPKDRPHQALHLIAAACRPSVTIAPRPPRQVSLSFDRCKRFFASESSIR